MLNLLNSSGETLYVEMVFEEFPKLEFKVGCKEQEFDFSKELVALENAVKLISDFEVSEIVDISFDEISRYGTVICQLHCISEASSNLFKSEFSVDGESLIQTRKLHVFLW